MAFPEVLAQWLKSTCGPQALDPELCCKDPKQRTHLAAAVNVMSLAHFTLRKVKATSCLRCQLQVRPSRSRVHKCSQRHLFRLFGCGKRICKCVTRSASLDISAIQTPVKEWAPWLHQVHGCRPLSLTAVLKSRGHSPDQDVAPRSELPKSLVP